jgi:hypothetical protein
MKLAPLIVLLSAALLSCTDDPIDNPEVTIKLEELTTGSWKFTGYIADYYQDGVFDEDFYPSWEPCYKDNLYTFYLNDSITRDEGPDRCIGQIQIQTSAWSFTANQTRLQWLIFGLSDHQIEELSSTTMRLKSESTHNLISKKDVEMTFTKQ